MSRVGKNPVAVPAGVTVSVTGNQIKAKGKMGELSFDFTNDVSVKVDGAKVWVKPSSESQRSRTMWGTVRAQINNLVKGVDKGFSKKLDVNGVGFKAAVAGKELKMSLGFSHEVKFEIPEGIKIVCATPTSVEISGASKQKVGQVASEIRALRPPEPYKGKGIKYGGEYILRKEGKKK